MQRVDAVRVGSQIVDHATRVIAAAVIHEQEGDIVVSLDEAADHPTIKTGGLVVAGNDKDGGSPETHDFSPEGRCLEAFETTEVGSTVRQVGDMLKQAQPRILQLFILSHDQYLIEEQIDRRLQHCE